jgi:hypothetical protein
MRREEPAQRAANDQCSSVLCHVILTETLCAHLKLSLCLVQTVDHNAGAIAHKPQRDRLANATS